MPYAEGGLVGKGREKLNEDGQAPVGGETQRARR